MQYQFNEHVGRQAVVVYGRPGEFVSTVLDGAGSPHIEPRQFQVHAELGHAISRAQDLVLDLRLAGMTAREAVTRRLLG